MKYPQYWMYFLGTYFLLLLIPALTEKSKCRSVISFQIHEPASSHTAFKVVNISFHYFTT